MADELNIKIGVSSTAGQSFARLRSQTAKMRTALKITRPTMRGLGAAARKMAATMAGPAVRGASRLIGRLKELKAQGGITRKILGGLGGLLRGVFTGGLMVAGAAVMGLRSAFSGMRDAMESGGDGLGAMDEQATETADGLQKAADTSKSAIEEISGVFGAWGQVGEGFVQTQGKLADQAEATAAGAVATAKESAAAMDDARDSIGGATTATTRFGRATDRIANAFNRAKTIILRAIANAITPALEKFADLLESPTFQKFVDLLANELAKAAEKVADWFINDVIPALMDLMDEINEAGGVVEWIKGKFQEWKTTALMLLAIIMAKMLEASNFFRDVWQRAVNTVKTAFEILKISIITLLMEASTAAQNILTGMGAIIAGVINALLSGIEDAINTAIRILRPFVAMYNAVAEATGGGKIEMLSSVSLPRLQTGGIVDGPMAAIVGDAPSPEVISPLDDLVGILQDAGIGVGDMNIYVTVPSGTNDPVGFGNSVGNGIAQALRRSGQRVPTI